MLEYLGRMNNRIVADALVMQGINLLNSSSALAMFWHQTPAFAVKKTSVALKN